MMVLSAIATKVAIGLGMASLVADLTSPEWAAPINTALLILLAVVAGKNGARIKDTQEHTKQVKEKVDAAASAAASAAQAAADAARVARDVGGRFRDHSGALPVQVVEPTE